MSRRVAVWVLIFAVLMWGVGAFVFLFAESWWRLIGVVVYSATIPLFIPAGRALRRPQDSEPSQ